MPNSISDFQLISYPSRKLTVTHSNRFRDKGYEILSASETLSSDGTAVNGLVSCSKFEKKPLKRNRGQLSANGKQRVKDGCAVLEKHVGKEYCAFVTLTFPSEYDRKHTKEAIASLMHLFLRKLAYHARKLGLPEHWVYVVEAHPKRSEKVGTEIPHIHMAIQTALEPYKWLLDKGTIQKLWIDAVQAVYGAIGASFAASTQVASIKKSVANYMAKYLSKSNNPPGQNVKRLKLNQYWGMSKALLKLVKASIIKLTGEAAYQVWKVLEQGHKGLNRYEIYLSEDDVVPLAYVYYAYGARLNRMIDGLINWGQSLTAST